MAGAAFSGPDLVAGTVTALSPRVRRLIAPNPGRMTGAGTNTYIVGTRDLVVIDPGPAIPSHVEQLVALVGDKLRWILVTHTHSDHSPAAKLLAARTGAPQLGLIPRGREYHDETFIPSEALADGRRVRIDGCTLEAVATPGHASNHVCWYLQEERIVFTGDHVLGGVTPVILPPDGDMGEYLDSLARLQALDLVSIAPGHGGLIDAPQVLLAALVRHRLQREAKVLRVVAELADATQAELLPVVYDDVDPEMHRWARYSLDAHLIKLVRDGRVDRDGDRYRPR